MTSLEEYRCADYDMDIYFDETTSWPDGLSERYRFEPNLPRAVRHTSSAEDIQRYKDHFSIAQRNQGCTWKKYLKIILDDLRHFDTLVLMSKAFPERFAGLRESETSHYVTASEQEITDKSILTRKTIKKKSFDETEDAGDTDSVPSMEYVTVNSNSSVTLPKRLASTRESENSLYVTSGSDFSLPRYKIIRRKSIVKKESAGDTDSVSSTMYLSTNSFSSDGSINISNVPFSPQKNFLKKFCTGVRQFASKTKKTVEKVSVKSKYCSACGDHIASVKVHKECSQNALDYRRPPVPGIQRNNTNLARTISMSLNSVTSTGSGESSINPQSFQQAPSSYKKKVFVKRMLPFVKESPKEMKNDSQRKILLKR